jgi:hypothetical protein
MDISIFVHYGTGSRIPPLTASLATRIIRNNVIILGMSSGLDLLDFHFSRAVREVASRSWSIPSPSLLILTGKRLPCSNSLRDLYICC